MPFRALCAVIYRPAADQNRPDIDVFFRIYFKLVARPQEGVVNMFTSLDTLSDRMHVLPERFRVSIKLPESIAYLISGLIDLVIEGLVVIGVQKVEISAFDLDQNDIHTRPACENDKIDLPIIQWKFGETEIFVIRLCVGFTEDGQVSFEQALDVSLASAFDYECFDICFRKHALFDFKPAFDRGGVGLPGGIHERVASKAQLVCSANDSAVRSASVIQLV